VLAALQDAAAKIILPAKLKGETDEARKFLNDAGVPFQLAPATGPRLTLTVGAGAPVPGFNAAAYTAALAPAGYPKSADPRRFNYLAVVGLLVVLVLYVTLVYGPIAAFLVELFPTNIRYTSMSLPYHIGNGWFGGFLPLIATSLVVFSGDIYAGLWYPIAIATAALLIGAWLLPENKDRPL
jgi:hypothetical protein